MPCQVCIFLGPFFAHHLLFVSVSASLRLCARVRPSDAARPRALRVTVRPYGVARSAYREPYFYTAYGFTCYTLSTRSLHM